MNVQKRYSRVSLDQGDFLHTNPSLDDESHSTAMGQFLQFFGFFDFPKYFIQKKDFMYF